MSNLSAPCVICGGPDCCPIGRQPRDYEYFIVPERELAVLHCRTCGSEFIHPRPTVPEIESFYPADYHSYNDDQRLIAGMLIKIRSRSRARLYNKLIKTRPISLFDVGTGDGRHFSDLSKCGSFRFAGIEINPEMAEAAARGGYRIETGSIENLDTAPYENSFDLVTMYQLVDHVLDPQLLFQKALAMLKPGGYVMGQLPSMDCIERGLFGRYWAGYHYPRHLQMMPRKALADLLWRSGFREVQVKSALHVHAAQSMQNLLVGRLGYHPKMMYGKVPTYSALMLLAAPFCIVEHMLNLGGMMDFTARKPIGSDSSMRMDQ
jgi:SAM-dependent methyltransferase